MSIEYCLGPFTQHHVSGYGLNRRPFHSKFNQYQRPGVWLWGWRKYTTSCHSWLWEDQHVSLFYVPKTAETVQLTRPPPIRLRGGFRADVIRDRCWRHGDNKVGVVSARGWTMWKDASASNGLATPSKTRAAGLMWCIQRGATRNTGRFIPLKIEFKNEKLILKITTINSTSSANFVEFQQFAEFIRNLIRAAV